MKRKLIALAVGAAIAFGSAPAHAAQTQAEVDAVATYEKLTVLVTNIVASTYNTIETTVANTAKSTLKSLLTPANVKAALQPMIKEALLGQLNNFNLSGAAIDPYLDQIIDSALTIAIDNKFVDSLMANEFVQAVTNRTIDYAVKDIMAQLNVRGDEAAQVKSYVDSIWNAPLQSVGTATTKVKGDIGVACALGICTNGSYQTFTTVAWNTNVLGGKSTPKDINVTGWNSVTITTYVGGGTTLTTAGQIKTYQEKLASIDLAPILIKALARAIVDEIKIRIDALTLKAKTALTKAISDAMTKAKMPVTLKAASSMQEITNAIGKVLTGKTDAQIGTVISLLKK